MPKSEADINYRVSPEVTNDGLNALFAVAWQGHTWRDFEPVLNRSLTFVCAYYGARLVGFVNLAWDGGYHAFILDTTILGSLHRSITAISSITNQLEL
jgi:hypothetical protein